MKFKLELDGLDAVLKMLSELPNDLNEKIQYDINRQAANIAKEQLIADSPSQEIAENVMISKTPRTKTGVSIGYKRKVFHVKFLEKGTRVRSTKGNSKYYKNKANRGSIARKPFIIQSHQKAAPNIIKFVSTNFLRLINKSLKKHTKRLRRGKR
ncbi:MAG TPA: hypothetical protein VD927_11290 [Chryseosolibacter sp.]|nr:hypothetical protein [Chryseosolibacter sp.]